MKINIDFKDVKHIQYNKILELEIVDYIIQEEVFNFGYWNF